jgi:transposase InsO family protein
MNRRVRTPRDGVITRPSACDTAHDSVAATDGLSDWPERVGSSESYKIQPPTKMLENLEFAMHRTQAWSAFVRNHARSVLASDSFVVMTATFRLLHVFVVLEVGTRRIVHWNVTAHPTANWTA